MSEMEEERISNDFPYVAYFQIIILLFYSGPPRPADGEELIVVVVHHVECQSGLESGSITGKAKEDASAVRRV